MTVSSYEFIMDIISSNDISLSKSEESILNTLKLHSYDITSFDIADFAKTFFVSNATVTRFSQKLGFSGYQELRYAISESKEVSIYKSQDIYLSMINSIEELPERNIKLIKNLNSFSKIAIIGIGSSGLCANEFVYKLRELDLFTSDYAKEPYSINLLTKNLSYNDLLIAISLSGENHTILEGVNNAIDKGSPVFSITRNCDSSLGKISDYIMPTPAYPHHSYEISRMAPILITMDIICELYQKN